MASLALRKQVRDRSLSGTDKTAVVELASLLFLVLFSSCGRFFGCSRRRETHFVFFHVAAQVARRKTSHAFSLALAVLDAFEMPSLALQRQKARGVLSLSS